MNALIAHLKRIGYLEEREAKRRGAVNMRFVGDGGDQAGR
jgi:hypothetical protein